MALSPRTFYLFYYAAPRLFIPPIMILTVRAGLLKSHKAQVLSCALASSWAIMLSSILLLATYELGSLWLADMSRAKEARRLGAKFLPRVKGRLPGNLDHLWDAVFNWPSDYIGHPVARLTQQYGSTFHLRILSEDCIFTSNPAHVRQLLVSEAANYEKGEIFGSVTASSIGDSTFSSDGHVWKWKRATARPFFYRDPKIEFENFTRHADIARSQLTNMIGSSQPVNMQEIVSRFSLDSTSEYLFGQSMDTLCAPLTPQSQANNQNPVGVNRIFYSVESAQRDIVRRINFGRHWPLFELLGDRTKKDVDFLRAYLTPIMETALEQEQMRRNIGGLGEKTRAMPLHEASNFLEYLVSKTDDKQTIMNEILLFTTASFDSSSASTTFTLYFLSQYPEVFARLRAEILAIVGSNAAPSPEQVKSMTYLRAVINETMRLIPPAPFNVRQARDSTTWAGPSGEKYYIPRGVAIAYSLVGLHTDPEIWGPDANVFDPERWLDSRALKHQSPGLLSFAPFSAGPRTCVGQQFALNQMSCFIIRLLQVIDHLELAPDALPLDCRPPAEWKNDPFGRKAVEKVIPLYRFASYCKGGLWVRMDAKEKYLDV